MDNNTPDDARQSLFDEFESEIVKAGNSEAFFDENDLIEIFDYASDLDNYIVKMEVLLYGARHYPDSQALATRRAWFYSSFGEMEAAAEVNRRVSNGGVLNKLLALRAEGALNTPETRARLDETVEAATEFGDEDVIQLVDLCAELGMLDWVEANRGKVESKTSYPQTFIYEYADRAEEGGDYATAARLFEELTMMEPFTLDFWLRLATVQHNKEDFEAALSSADFALAIDPDSTEGLRVKASSLFRLNREVPYVISTFRNLVARPDASEQDIIYLSYALCSTNDEKGAVEEIIRYISSHSFSRNIIDCLISIDIKAGEKFLIDHYADIPEVSFADWATEHIRMGNFEIAAAILVVASQHDTSNELIPKVMEACYLAGRYKEAENIYDNCVSTRVDIWPHHPSVAIPYVMSLVRLGERQKALDSCNHILESFMRFDSKYDLWKGTVSPITFICQNIGYQAALRSIILGLQSDPAIPADDFDPFRV